MKPHSLFPYSHSFLTSSLHRIPQIPISSPTHYPQPSLKSCNFRRGLYCKCERKCAWLCVFKALGLVKVLDKGQWRDALQVGKQEGMSGASLGSEGNAIIPQPHPAGVKIHGHLGKNLSTPENSKNPSPELWFVGKKTVIEMAKKRKLKMTRKSNLLLNLRKTLIREEIRFQ